ELKEISITKYKYNIMFTCSKDINITYIYRRYYKLHFTKDERIEEPLHRNNNIIIKGGGGASRKAGLTQASHIAASPPLEIVIVRSLAHAACQPIYGHIAQYALTIN
ncbi:hypothetical protein ACJX0J_018150, partial [Zea mays]